MSLQTLYPSKLWQFFNDICNIPHPSGHEEKISEYVMQFAQIRGLVCEKDEIGNILIKKPVSNSSKRCIALQSHLDMVPQKNENTIHDFVTDSIKPLIVGEWVKATGTTLGADNGIGLASILAVLDDKSLSHPAIEALFTIDEERGLTGASNLKANWLKSSILLNTDSEEEGEFSVGCAGGVDFTAELLIERNPVQGSCHFFEIAITGLKGGHSGMDIHLGLANAIKLLARCLHFFDSKVSYDLCEFRGGNLRNAIPREAFAVIAIPYDALELFKAAFSTFQMTLNNEYFIIEPSLSLSYKKTNPSDVCYAKNFTQRFIASLYAVHNGVYRMIPSMPDVVETSGNLASVSENSNSLLVKFLLRSSVNSSKVDLCNMVSAAMLLAGADVKITGAYSGWQPLWDANSLRIVKEVYKQKFGHDPIVKVVHAGLECGIIKDKYPDMEMISFGPTIVSPHSPDEAVHITSVGKYWDFLITVLKEF